MILFRSPEVHGKETKALCPFLSSWWSLALSRKCVHQKQDDTHMCTALENETSLLTSCSRKGGTDIWYLCTFVRLSFS